MNLRKIKLKKKLGKGNLKRIRMKAKEKREKIIGEREF